MAARKAQAKRATETGDRPNRPPRMAELAARRIAIEGIDPEIDGGRFAARAVEGRPLVIEADIFGDGHEVLGAALLFRADRAADWTETPMDHVINDRWRATVTPRAPGACEFTLIAWRDLFGTWARDTGKKLAAGQEVALEAEEGRLILAEAAAATEGPEGETLRSLAARMEGADTAARIATLTAPDTAALMARHGPRANLTPLDRALPVMVDRTRAAFSAWYELLPRSQGPGGRHGTLRDVIDRLPYVAGLGFDVLYFPPIHPIGKVNRKGRNNSLTPGPDDPGSPYAIGSPEGGHKDIHPDLGTMEDFDALVQAARGHGLEIALDFAIQCAPDHPWVRDHPEWFDWRPDGTIKFAENPPKKYEDIVNVHFYRKALPDLWLELRDVVEHWIAHGVTIFRVDNPHTKPFPFWEWLIADVRSRHPGTVFLAEAFTRPKVMKRLAKVGFNQSYSYFTWRNTKAELTEYLEELTTTEARHVMRPNFFVNTPDINPFFLQSSGRPGFRTRLILAGTLSPNYGVYNGYEICEATPVPGTEEYLDSEKYHLRRWNMDAPGHIQDDIRLLNRLRNAHPALQDFANLHFVNAFDDAVLSYLKHDGAADDFLLFHVNLDPHTPRTFAFEVPLWDFGLPDDASIEVEDAIHGNRFTWHGKTHHLTLDPETRPYAIWRLFPPGRARN